MHLLGDNDSYLARSCKWIALDAVEEEGKPHPIPRPFNARIGSIALAIDLLQKSLELGQIAHAARTFTCSGRTNDVIGARPLPWATDRLEFDTPDPLPCRYTVDIWALTVTPPARWPTMLRAPAPCFDRGPSSSIHWFRRPVPPYRVPLTNQFSSPTAAFASPTGPHSRRLCDGRVRPSHGGEELAVGRRAKGQAAGCCGYPTDRMSIFRSTNR